MEIAAEVFLPVTTRHYSTGCIAKRVTSALLANSQGQALAFSDHGLLKLLLTDKQCLEKPARATILLRFFKSWTITLYTFVLCKIARAMKCKRLLTPVLVDVRWRVIASRIGLDYQEC